MKTLGVCLAALFAACTILCLCAFIKSHSIVSEVEAAFSAILTTLQTIACLTDAIKDQNKTKEP